MVLNVFFLCLYFFSWFSIVGCLYLGLVDYNLIFFPLSFTFACFSSPVSILTSPHVSPTRFFSFPSLHSISSFCLSIIPSPLPFSPLSSPLSPLRRFVGGGAVSPSSPRSGRRPGRGAPSTGSRWGPGYRGGVASVIFEPYHSWAC